MEVVAQEHVGWRGLFAGGFQCRMRFHERHRGQPPAIRDPENASPSIVIRDVFDQPVDGVIGIGSFVNRTGLGAVARGALHLELAFGIVASADVLEDENKTLVGELLVAVLERSSQSLLPVQPYGDRSMSRGSLPD